MTEDEDMAILFYKVGDAKDLAKQLITILRSPELESQMAEQNFAAGTEMTMAKVVGNYLRWFELKRCKRLIGSLDSYKSRRRTWLGDNNVRSALPDLSGQGD